MPSMLDLKTSGAVANTISPDALFLVTNTPNTNPTSNVVSLQGIANSVNQIQANTVALMTTNTTPANSTITVAHGVFWCDGSYLYIAVSDNLVKRVALSSF